MGRVDRQCLSMAFGVFAALLGTRLSDARENTAEAELRQSVHQLERWLGTSPEADGWRNFLKSDQLASQMEKGAGADRGVVRTILDRYESGTPGLNLWRFVAVRNALRNWLDTLPTWSADQLSDAAREAKTVFTPVTESDVKRERGRLATAIGNLGRLLRKATQEDATRWKDTVKWDQLESQVAGPDSSPDLKTLQGISELYYQDVAGLEQDEFLAVRQSLDKYVSVALFASSPDSKKYYESYLDGLAEKLRSYGQEPKTDDAIAIARMLGWLDRFGQAGELVAAARSNYSRPNLFVEFSETLMQAGIDQNVNETAAVNEVILGTRVRGNAHIRGAVTLDLVPNEEYGAMDLLLTGSTVSNTVGYNGPVRIFSRGLTNVGARKRLRLDEGGLSDRPATARASTNTRIGRVEAGHLIRHIAMKRIRRSKAEGEAIASRRAAGRIAASVDDRSSDLLSNANASFADKFRLPLVRLGGFPRLLQFSTTDDALRITMLESGRNQLAAPDAPPVLTGTFDLAVRMHESLVGNFSQAVLGGVTLKDERLVEIVKQLTGTVPKELEITQEDDPWSITFASELDARNPGLPIEVRFDDQTAKILIRGKRFTRGDPPTDEIRRPIEISATYTIEKLPDRARMVRQGDVQIDLVGRAKFERGGHRHEDLHEKEVGRVVQAGVRLRRPRVARTLEEHRQAEARTVVLRQCLGRPGLAQAVGTRRSRWRRGQQQLRAWESQSAGSRPVRIFGSYY